MLYRLVYCFESCSTFLAMLFMSMSFQALMPIQAEQSIYILVTTAPVSKV